MKLPTSVSRRSKTLGGDLRPSESQELDDLNASRGLPPIGIHIDSRPLGCYGQDESNNIKKVLASIHSDRCWVREIEVFDPEDDCNTLAKVQVLISFFPSLIFFPCLKQLNFSWVLLDL
jgi:hypothetical protein